MKIELAKTAGFCFGVKRAVNCVYEQAEQTDDTVYTYGPIIHNEQVVEDLSARGVRVIDEGDGELPSKGIVVIRSHGVSRAEQERLQRSGLTIVDATCPFVKKIHLAVEEASAAGRTVVIAGDPEHPEVIGIRGWCSADSYVVSSPEDCDFLPPELDRITLVSQTTFHHIKFEEIVEKLSEKVYDCSVVNTICNATLERQKEAREIAKRVEAMIVVGGRHSSNTQKLYELCSRECKHTYYVQTLDDLATKGFPHYSSVGITAGASTPNTIIEEVCTHVRSI